MKNSIFCKNNKFKIKIFFIILLVIDIILFWYNKKEFFDILKINKDFIKLLSPIIVLFICIYIINSFFKRMDFGNYLTFCSIIIAILFFMFNLTFDRVKQQQENENKYLAIEKTNFFNCSKAYNLKTLQENNNRFVLSNYILDMYEKNIDFIYSKYGKEKGEKIIQSLEFMKGTNSLIDIVKNMNTQIAYVNVDSEAARINNLINLRNNDIMNNSKEIYSLLCQ